MAKIRLSRVESSAFKHLSYVGPSVHHWSGYGDGHKDINHLVEQILTSPAYEDIKQRILKCEVLIIDEIGFLSCKAFDDIEFICRNVCISVIIFGSIHLIAGGSFLQLPPVPSLFDVGKYAFQSDMFKKTFPHKIKLDQVMQQEEPELIDAINQLCVGNPAQQSIQFLSRFQRPITHTDDRVFIFGTNLDVDFFNHQKLEQLPGNMPTFTATDKGPQ